MYISESSGERDEQSANLPGKASPSRIPLRKTVSRAAFAALRALSDNKHFSIIARASPGLRSKKSASASPTTPSTAFFASGLPNLPLV